MLTWCFFVLFVFGENRQPLCLPLREPVWVLFGASLAPEPLVRVLFSTTRVFETLFSLN